MRQTISIPDNKIDVIRHLKSQINMSGYIVKLIEKDMENQLLTKDEIVKLIEKHGVGKKEIDMGLMDSITGCLDF